MAGWRKKTWKDRKTEYPTRRTLTKTDGSTEIVTVTRNEGQVSQEGDAFSADNLNDLETRIDDGFTEVNGKLSTTNYDIVFPTGVTADFVYCKRTGNIVNFGFRILSASIQYGTPIAYLSTGALPNQNILIPGQRLIIDDKIYAGNVLVSTNGNINQECADGKFNSGVIQGSFII